MLCLIFEYLSHFLIPDTLCNNGLKHFVIPDTNSNKIVTLCNTWHFVIPYFESYYNNFNISFQYYQIKVSKGICELNFDNEMVPHVPVTGPFIT